MLFSRLFLSSLNYAELGYLQLNAYKEVSATPAAFLKRRIGELLWEPGL